MTRILRAFIRLLLPRPRERTTRVEVSRISDDIEKRTKERLANAYELAAEDQEDISQHIDQISGTPEENERMHRIAQRYRERARLRREEMRRLLKDLEERRC